MSETDADAMRRRVAAGFHAISLRWDAPARSAPTESPIARVERLAAKFRSEPVVASPLLLKTLGIGPTPDRGSHGDAVAVGKTKA